MMNIYEITTTNASKLTKDSEVNAVLCSIAENFMNSEHSAKDTAILCHKMKNLPAFSEGGRYSEMNYAKMIEQYFGKNLTAASAYKYAQCVETFKGGAGHLPEIWESFPIGKLIVLVSLESKKHKEKGRSIEGFFCYIGEKINQPIADKYAEWLTENETTIANIERLKAAGMDDIAETIKLPNEPPHPVADDDAERADKLFAMGLSGIRSMTDKALKNAVSEYAPSEKKATPTQSEESTGKVDGESKPKTAAELKAIAAAAVADYIAAAEAEGETVRNTIKQVANMLKA